MGKVQRLGVEIIQSIHTHESKGIISVVGNNKESYMEEIWKKVVGFENYEVSNKGKVRNKETGNVLNPWIINSGYLSLIIINNKGKPKHKTIHRLVAENFISNTDTSKNIVNHIDNNKLNNCVENLEWVSYKGNSAHANKQGRLNTYSAREKLSSVSKKAIYQKDMEGNIIKLWDSPSEAEKESNGYFSSSKISSVAHGKRKHHRNYIWEYVYKDSNRSLNKSINMYDLNNNLLYKDLTMNKIMGILEMNNHKTLRDKLRNTDDFVEYRGYKFKNNN